LGLDAYHRGFEFIHQVFNFITIILMKKDAIEMDETKQAIKLIISFINLSITFSLILV